MKQLSPTPMQALPHQASNFELRMQAHNGQNPVHEERVQKAFQMKSPKLKHEMPKADPTGSPWLSMGGNK